MKTVSAKVPDEVFEKMKEMADKKNLTISSLIKQTFQNGGIKDLSIKKNFFYQIKRIGNNLNQIARHCNMKKVVDKEVFLKLIDIEKKIESLKDDM